MKKKDYEKLLKNLPQTSGIHGQSRQLNSAVLVPFIEKEGEYHILFELRAQDIMQGGEVCFPGGLYDKALDKSYLDTAIRETIEELGIAEEKIKVQGLMDTFVTGMGMIIVPFVGLLDIKDINELKPDAKEVERLFTMPVEFFKNTEPDVHHVKVEMQPFYTDEKGKEVVLFPAKELGLPERYHKPWGGKLVSILVYESTDPVIWGFTADILHELVQMM